ncbi:MAG: hypothetical protein GY906_09775 [bacterium]|nr:hypothetical protein [bacterium]
MSTDYDNLQDQLLDGETTKEHPGESSPGFSLDADSILDTIVPDTIDWRNTVRRHPIGSVLAVGLVGYVVGRTKGAMIMAGMTAGLSSAMMRQLSDVFEGDFFEF